MVCTEKLWDRGARDKGFRGGIRDEARDGGNGLQMLMVAK